MTVVTLQGINPNTSMFQPDQVLDFAVDTWDTPFAFLEGDTASNGIYMDVRQPTSTGVYTVKTNLDSATAANCTSTFLNSSFSSAIVTGGRTPVLMNYWAGGAPAQHGAEFNAQVAYHFKCTLRGVPGREWWSNAGSVTFCLAYAGFGYVRVTKTVAGVTSDVTYTDNTGASQPLKRQITEGLYLQNGLLISDSITLSTGDSLDIYYIQDVSDDWGGFVFKPVLGATPTTTQINQAPVLDCSIFDDGTTPTKRTLGAITQVTTERDIVGTETAEISLALVNSSVTDGAGWFYTKPSDTDPGYLTYGDGAGTSFTLRRGRLMRIKAGFSGELYTVFTGFVDDFGDLSEGTLSLKCAGFAQRLLDQFCKNYPDKISYMSVGYKQLTGFSEPVYDITAWDNWPIEYAIRELCRRGGIPEGVTTEQLCVRNSDGTTPAITMGSEAFQKVRMHTMPILNEGGSTTASTAIKIERPVHYGNAGRGFNPALPQDDSYLFPPENKTDIWSQCRTFADKYGFDLRFDLLGQLIVQPINTPHLAWSFNSNFGQSPTVKKNPNAFNGTYLEWTNTVNPITKSVTAARIDLVVPRGVNHGNWAYTVVNGVGVTVASGTIVPALPAGSADEFYYDFVAATNGGNATVFTLYTGDYGTYSVTLQSSGTGALTRRLDSFLLWHTDTFLPHYAYAFSTAQNAITASAKGLMNDTRNLVYVVGRRKAVVTDSDKFFDANENPNNPEAEFIVQVGVDVGSVIDPTATNYLGYPKESVIYDSNITDDDFAGYIARTFIYKYRIPKPAASVEHTIIPALNLREPVFVAETVYDTLDTQSVLWVTTIKHTLTYSKSLTSVDCTSYAPTPSYLPRTDVDIDANYGGSPVANVQISYVPLTGGSAISNLGPHDEYVSGSSDISFYASVPVTAGSPEYLDMTGKDWPPVPGTVFIRPGTGASPDQQPTNTVTGLTGVFNQGALYTAAAPTTVNGAEITVATVDGYSDMAGIKSCSIHLQFYPGGSIDKTIYAVKPATLPTVTQFYYVFDPSIPQLRIQAVMATQGWGGFTGVVTGACSVTFTYLINNTFGGTGWITNTPYHHFMNTDCRTGAGQRRIYLPWNNGDKGTGFFSGGCSRGTTVTSYDVRYRRLGPVDGSHNFSDPYGGTSPFYDPYTSELGYLVTVQFDALVSGLYRISIRNTDDDTVVAWLTDPSNTPSDPEQHWSFITAGAGQQLTWDGVDNVGQWNQAQSVQYAATAAGAFEQTDQPVIGKGWYVWNREINQNGGFGSLALIAGTVSAMNESSFGHATYAKWYVKFEAENEHLVAIAAAAQALGGTSASSLAIPRVLNTTSMDPTIHSAAIKFSRNVTSAGNNTLNDTTQAWRTNQWVGYQVRLTSGAGVGQIRQILSNSASQLVIAPSTTDPNIWAINPVNGNTYNIESTTALIYTHLPEPTKVELVEISDYINATAYNELSPPTSDAGNWQDSPNTDAVFNNQKPVRIRFNVQPRPGTLWSGNEQKAAIRLYRVAHLRAHILDQGLIFNGYNYPNTSVESKTLYNRRLANDEHTILYGDDTWIQGLSFKQTTAGSGYEWVFLPKYFRKNFRGIENESIQFNDYLQLEEVPKWTATRQPNAPRSRLHFALMNYLFFLSAYTQDRSGRYIWCMDRKFIDRSKILNNAYGDWFDPTSVATPPAAATSTTYRKNWAHDLNTQFVRSVIVRQWQDEGTWRADQNTLWNFGGAGKIGYELLRFKMSDHDPQSTTLNGNNWSTYGVKTDNHSKWHQDGRTQLVGTFDRQLGDTATNIMGKWTWETGPTWVPCITRDLHGYYMVAPMMDKDPATDPRQHYIYLQVDWRGYNGSTNEGDDTAGSLQWNSPVWDMTQGYSSSGSGVVRFWPGTVVDPQAGPTMNIISSATMDYIRQDDLVHYEELRGMFSRGSRPAEAAKRITPSSAYYSNVTAAGSGMGYQQARLQPGYPLFTCRMGLQGNGSSSRNVIGTTFWYTFRYEYLWESGSFYPTQGAGTELLQYVNAYKCQMEPYANIAGVQYDSGAWTGWKDDTITASNAENTLGVYNATTNLTPSTPFDTGYMPVAVGTLIRNPDNSLVTLEMIFSMVLVNSRRNISI